MTKQRLCGLGVAAAAMVTLVLTTASVDAGTISYIKVTNDADSGIYATDSYTHALDFDTSTTGVTINGVPFAGYKNSNNGTLNFSRTAANGTLNEHNGTGIVSTSGSVANLMQGFFYNGSPATDGTGLQTYTISGLAAGPTYDARLYSHQWANPPGRPNTLVFDPDGAGAISDSTGVIDQDVATTVGMPNATDSYFINYRYTAVAGQDLVITAANSVGSAASWHLYGFSNQVARDPSNLLANGSFEDPVAANMNSNNLGTIPTGWSQTGADGTWNLVRVDGGGYGGGPDNAEDGNQYVDLNGEFELFQNFTLTETSDLEFGAWFSNRERNTDDSPSTVGIYNAAGDTLVSSLASVNLFGQATPSTSWTLGQQTLNNVAPGTYQLRIDLNNFNNVDSAFVTVVPEPATFALVSIGLLGRRRRR